MSGSQQPPPEGPPSIVLQRAAAAAAAGQEDDEYDRHSRTSEHRSHHYQSDQPDLEDVPPPAYNGADYGQLNISQNGLDTGAKVGDDGRINIKFNERTHKLSDLLIPALRKQLAIQKKQDAQEAQIPPGLGETEGLSPPPMNIVIQIVGSRGDVQPFVALGQVLKKKYKHRVRIATHPTFRQFVTENGLEFFSIGGDPAELMAFMVKNPGLMPGMDSMKAGDVGKRRKGIYEMITGCWRSCIEAGDGTGARASDDMLDGQTFDSAAHMADPTLRPFVADAIIANPPSFAHLHIAEKLGIPLHLMFTMPWSPTQSFPHPLANIVSSNTDPNMANFMTYALVDMLTWQGLGDVINRFREKSLGLEPISIMWAPGMASRLRIPWTYCWSPALIPKPTDWGKYIDVSGFYFLNLATDYTPEEDLARFLAAGPPPVYIGFGSIVVDDPNAMTKMIFEAVKKTGQRALVSKGWGGIGAEQLGLPDGVFMLGNVPHDWLFKHVSCVVHHGGAGTTAAGITAGRPTVVVPFFGDQPFWGAMVARAGAGPMPIPYKNLTADKLAAQITEALKPASLERAAELSDKIKTENGNEAGAESFHNQMHLEDMRCTLCPETVAVWRVKRTDIRLSALAATVLSNEGLLDFTELKLYRPREYETEDGPWDPISGGAAALIGTIGNLSMGVADFPIELIKGLKAASSEVKGSHKNVKSSSGTATPTTPAADNSSQPLSSPGRQASMTGYKDNDLPRADTAQSSKSSGSIDLSPTKEDEKRPSAMAAVMRHGSHSSQPRRLSFSRENSPFGGRPRSPGSGQELGNITLESAIGGARAVSKIVGAGVKSPMDFTMSLAKGFHNAPKLYGDETVRKSGKITGIQSGFAEAGKEFGYGFYDGITGLVTQPIAGARKEGFGGFIKGAAKGIGGLILKPGAGVWAIPGYTARGVYAELTKHFGSSVQNYIIAARTAQGYDEWKNSTPQQRQSIVEAWTSTKIEMRKGGKKISKEKKQEIEKPITQPDTSSAGLVHGFKNTKHLSWDERKALSNRKEQLKKEEKERKRQVAEDVKRGVSNGGKVQSSLRSGHVETLDPEFEEAVQKSVKATSRGNPEEDALVEAALRASMKELQKNKVQAGQQNAPPDEHDDEAYNRAVAASIEEAKRFKADQQIENPPSYGDSHGREMAHDMTREQHEPSQSHGHNEQRMGSIRLHDNELEHNQHESDSDSGLGTEDDEDFKRTLEESKREHTENERQRSEPGTANKQSAWTTQTEVAPDDEEDDEELRKALTASERESKAKDDEAKKQMTEEEIVMEYVKRQSLMEDQHRKKREADRSGAGTRS